MSVFPFRIVPLAFALAAAGASCKEKKTNDGPFAACMQSNMNRCYEASGPNVTRFTTCDGEALMACPTEGRVGSCLNHKGQSDETIVRYYGGEGGMSLDDAKQACGGQPSLGGVFRPG